MLSKLLPFRQVFVALENFLVHSKKTFIDLKILVLPWRPKIFQIGPFFIHATHTLRIPVPITFLITNSQYLSLGMVSVLFT